MMTPGPRGRTLGEHTRHVGECRKGAKFQGHKRARKDRGPMDCTQSVVKNETWVATKRRQVLPSHGWLKGKQEPTQGEDHRRGKAKEPCRCGGMRSEEDEVWRSGPWRSLGSTLTAQG